jgi:hypothetical protein
MLSDNLTHKRAVLSSTVYFLERLQSMCSYMRAGAARIPVLGLRQQATLRDPRDRTVQVFTVGSR